MKSNADVTKHQKAGWKLVDTYTRLFGQQGEEKEGDQYLVYVLGWPRDKGPAKDSRLTV